MTDSPARPCVVVVGAGAAGIAAARALRDLGVPTLVLEARERVGGRAFSLAHSSGAPLDLGCEWLHSADVNLLAAAAADFGFTLDKTDPPWRRSPYRARRDDDDKGLWAAQETLDAKLEAAAGEAARGGRDRAAAELLEPGARWNGPLDAISTYYNGAPLARVSVVDYGRYRDTDVNWRVDGGYGNLIAAMGAGLPVRLGCAVMAVDATGRTLRVATSQGTIETDAVIVTVPTSVLAAGAIAFTPALDDHLAAAAGLPLGVADKLYLRLDQPEAFPLDTRLSTPAERRDAGSYTLRPRGRPMIEGYFGGDHARELEKGGLPAFAAAAREEIAAVFGHDDSQRLTPILATGWARDPLALGSYSHALPGYAEGRARLATPVQGRVFFAGEATSRHFFSTAHGAFETGLAAGRAAALAVGREHAAL